MIPSVSPSGPISRTSFAVICSLSRVSFVSFALIIQHLQTKKSVQRQSLRTAFLSHRDMNHINQGHPMCRGESGALCFVFLRIISHFPPLVKSFFSFFQYFFILSLKSPFQFFVRHFCLWKNNQKTSLFLRNFFHGMFFTKKNVHFRHN